MSSLPQNPSLESLKKEAKNLLKAFKKGSTQSCETLRLHPSFATLGNDALLQTKVTLQQAQHALSKQYGYDSWENLASYVQELSGGAHSNVAEIDSEELLENIYDAVIITSVDGKVYKYNSRTIDYLDFPPAVLAAKNIVDLISGMDTQVLETMAGTLQKEKRIFIEGYCRRADGTTFPADIAVSRLKRGKSERLIFFIRNITTRVETEGNLRTALEILNQHDVFKGTDLTSLRGQELKETLASHLKSFEDQTGEESKGGGSIRLKMKSK